MNSNQVEEEIKKKNEEYLRITDKLEPLLVEKHNLELKLMELGETIRLGRKAKSKVKLELEMLEDEKWMALRQERGL